MYETHIFVESDGYDGFRAFCVKLFMKRNSKGIY
jgi:hypothetical protein